MAVTQNTYTGNGSTVLYSFTFPYLETTDIKVSVNGVITTAYTLANATTIQFNTAPANGAAIRIYRQTDDSALSAQFYPGSAIRSQDLNDNFTQNLYVTQEVNSYAWDNEDDTVKSTQTWVSSDSKVATTAALDARFQDEFGETLTSSETWVSNNDLIPTTASVDQRIDTAITNDIGTDGTGITVTNDGDGTITLGLADNSIDFSKIKNDDIITYAEQEAGSPSWSSDTRLPTTFAAAQRFDTIVSPTQPTGSNWVVGKTWLQNDQDLTVSVWNGTNWLAVASGGAFINQPKVVYVDATAGDDNNDGHRISRPKQTIKAAINQINADATYGDGSVVVVAPGIYQEVAPIDITKKDVSVIGTALRSCVIHPTPATETNSLFRVNSGTFLQNLTFTGVKASGARGGVGSVDPDGTYGLPVTQGWNVSFYPGAMIYKSPYIQNCTNFSDSEINNANLNAHTPAGGSAGDTDSAVTGGGMLIDGAVVGSGSPLRSMVCDSYTHVGLDGPGILVTNNGYCQATSSYAFFNHYHIKCLNGGQANLAASTTDFGRYGLIADGRSTSAIFTAVTTANAADQDITFTIGTPVAGANWHGTATRPQSNMLVDIGGNTYPVLSAVANGTGWDVTISRPNPSDKTQNLGLDGAVSTGASVSFYLRSMVASSGHTMEYVGSGTNYSALPENGGVPVEAAQIVELNDGKIWTAITDHNGKFKLGNFFEVDQQSNSITVSTGSFPLDLSTLDVDLNGNAVFGANLDMGSYDILSSAGNVSINDVLSMNNNKIVDLADPANAQEAATKNYVDTNFLPNSNPTLTDQIFLDNAQNVALPDLAFDGDADTGVTSTGANELALVTGGTARLTIDSSGAVAIGGTATVGGETVLAGLVVDADVDAAAAIAGTKISPDFGSQNVTTTGTATAAALIPSGSSVPTNGVYLPSANNVAISTNGTGRLFVDNAGRVLVGPTTSRSILGGDRALQVEGVTGDASVITVYANVNNVGSAGSLILGKSRGTSFGSNTSVVSGDSLGAVLFAGSDGTNSLNAGVIAGQCDGTPSTNSMPGRLVFATNPGGGSGALERVRITNDGKVGIATTTPASTLTVGGNPPTAGAIGVVGASGGIALALSDNVNSSLYVRTATGGAVIGTDAGGVIRFATNGNATTDERARIDSSGRLGIGTSSPQKTLDVSGTARIRTGAKTGSNTYFQLESSDATNSMELSISNSSNTSWGIQAVENGVAYRPIILNAAGGEVYIAGSTDQGAYNLQCNGTGVWGAGAYVNGSDERLKTNVQNLGQSLTVIKALRPVTFQYKEEYSKDQSIQPGFIAQELQQALSGQPYLEGIVQAGPEYLNVAYQGLIAVLVKAVQELEAKVAALESV